MVRHVLLDYDREHGTDFFHGLSAEDVDVHENRVEEFLSARLSGRDARAGPRLVSRPPVAARTGPRRPPPLSGSSRGHPLVPTPACDVRRPQHGAARVAARRDAAVVERARSGVSGRVPLRAPGDERARWRGRRPRQQVAGLRRLADAGYRPFAVVDNEPAVIAALAEADESNEILFLQAQTLSESRRVPTPRTVRGRSYDLTALVAESDLPHHVQLVWHGVTTRPTCVSSSAHGSIGPSATCAATRSGASCSVTIRSRGLRGTAPNPCSCSTTCWRVCTSTGAA